MKKINWRFYHFLPLALLYFFLLVYFVPFSFLFKISFLGLIVFVFASIFLLAKDNLEQDWIFLVQIPLLSVGFYFFYFLAALDKKKNFPRLYETGSLERMERAIEMMVIFIFLSNFDFLVRFYHLSPILIFFAVFLLFTWLFFYRQYFYSFLFSFLFSEIYYALSFLPSVLYLNSLFMVFIYYLINQVWMRRQKKLGYKI